MYDNKDLTRYAKGTKILFQGFSTLTKAVFTVRATSPRAFSLPSRAFTTVETPLRVPPTPAAVSFASGQNGDRW